MSNRPNTLAPRGRRHSAPPPRRRWPVLWIGLGFLVALLALVAVLASGDSNPPGTTPGIEETRGVAVTGEALPPLSAGADPAIGRPVPLVEGASFDGTPMTIQGGDRAMVIAFVAHWCPHCQREVPLLSAHLDGTPMPDGVALVTVSTSTTEERPNYPPSAWLEREGWPGPVLADSPEGTAATAFGLTGFPYFVAVNPAGEVVARTSGEISVQEFDHLAALALEPVR